MLKYKFYSDYICKYYWNGSCHYSEKVFGGPPASCYYVNDFENCICFEPPIEYKKGSKNMMKCKYYSDYESGQHDFGVCHYEEAKGGFPMICTHKDNEKNCTCFESVKCEKESSPYKLNSTEIKIFSKLFKDYINDSNKIEKLVKVFQNYLMNASKSPSNAEGKCTNENALYRIIKERIEDKEEPEVVKKFKKNLDQIISVKIERIGFGDLKECRYVQFARVIDNCLGNFIVIDCTTDEVFTYSHAQYSWKEVPREASKVTYLDDKVKTEKLMTNREDYYNPRELTIQNCDKIILKPKNLEVEVKVEKDNFDDFDYITVNGHKFKRV